MLGIAAIMLISGYFVENKFLTYTFVVLGLILTLFTLWFFRDPDRTIPVEALNDESLVISPADGKIVQIEVENERHYIKGESKRISIFLSPIDVHVNRTPVSGTVEFYEYVPGDYLVAYHPKSSEKNEHSRIGVKNKYGKVFYKQIVGLVARRIVCDLKVGDTLTVGDKIGMMKFGSRMDIAMEPDTEVLVKIGDRVVAGKTIIAKLNKSN
ncbi:MAG: phosphatidylserine decarboxylase family protein [Ignavibacteriae bacterium]|nr:phosphatidylserine decarboxylase family protein [Ignavibacteriota bacterium]MCB9220725.1 phosphatidylserine decarboxylase family protein [Ignavibacteria bacterium]